MSRSGLPPAGAALYYEAQAQAYFDRTVALPMDDALARFLRQLPAGGAVLDAGCGSGRDALALQQRGFAVSAFDASGALAALARAHTGLPVAHMTFAQLEDVAAFDGVWACSSLVHLDAVAMDEALAHLVRAMRPGAVLYTSLKHGAAAYVDGQGRYFNRYLPDQASALLASAGLVMGECWNSPHGLEPGASWVNLLARKP